MTLAEDRFAIIETLDRYGLALDAKDWALLDQVFTPDAVGDFGEPHQNGACDHEGQCVLLSIWAMVSHHMRRHLDELTLADIAQMAQGEREWPLVETADSLD